MQSFRIYRLNLAGRILQGDWIEAPDETEAQRLAAELIGPGSPQVEIWQGSRRVAVLTSSET